MDFTRKTFTVEAASAKSGEARFIPLNSEVLGVLAAWRNQLGEPKSAEHVFTSPKGGALANCQTSWENLRKAAEITDFRFHDLRHTFAARMVQNGVGVDRVQKLLGHSTMEMTSRYAHLRDDDLRAAVEKLAAA